jgi:HNH endonuclease
MPSSWVQDIVSAFQNLGGTAHYGDLYEEVSRIRGGELPPSWQAIIRQSVESHSSDSRNFRGNDLFYSVRGIGSGYWGLRDRVLSTPHAEDLEEPQEARRSRVEEYRILRDTTLARTIKALHRNQCQICGTALSLADGSSYGEAHHIKPLGRPHNGPDIEGNIIVLCPNHHALCDLGAIQLTPEDLRSHPEHKISRQFIDYHNGHIVGG